MSLQPAEQVNRRIAQITDLARSSRLRLEGVKPGGVISGERFDRVPIQLKGSGNYSDCAEFAGQLRKRFPDIAVRAFRMTSQRSAAANLSTSFQIDLIWLAAPTELAHTFPQPSGTLK